MFDGKFIITLLSLLLGVMAICNMNAKKVTSVEGYLGTLNSLVPKKVREYAPDQSAAQKGQFFSTPGFGGNLPPRFYDGQYGANINYNPPDKKYLGVPPSPLGYANMASSSGGVYNSIPGTIGGEHKMSGSQEHYTENYGCNSCASPQSCGVGNQTPPFHGGAPMMESNYMAGSDNYKNVVESMDNSSYPTVTDSIPVGDMTTVNALGEVVQPIVYDRFIYANRNSRLRSQGDLIRGDLAIVPCEPGWFRPSVSPNIDLQQGAMNVIGGINNETTQAMTDLIMATSADSTISGVNMSSLRNTMAGSALADIKVTAFP